MYAKQSNLTDEELINKASLLAQELNSIHLNLKYKVQNKFYDAIVENMDMLHGILNNLAGIKINYQFVCKCGGLMKSGKAIEQTWTGMPDFPGDKYCVTLSPGGKGKLIDCMKCEKCGWSITK